MKRSPPAPELDHVLAGIARNRAPGFNYPGNFLQVAYDRVTKGASVLSLDAGPHCIDRDGQLNVGALALLADMALAASFRETVGRSSRQATVSMNLQFTGAPRTGRLLAEATFDGLIAGLAGDQGLARVSVTSNGKLVCTGSGGFMVFRAQEKKLAHPMKARSRAWRAPPMPAIEDFTPEESAILQRAKRALKASREHSFIESFWCYRPRATAHGATGTMPIDAHIGNRVGHAQGGVTFGFAAATASAALRDAKTGDRPPFPRNSERNGGLSPVLWRLVAANAWYVGPGTGGYLRAKSKVLHLGGLTAVVHTRVSNDEGRAVLECVTSHARLA